MACLISGILKIKRNFHQINNVTCFKLKINENTAELIDYKVNVSIFKAKKKWNETKISIFYYKKNSWIHSVMLLVDNYIHICRNIFIFLFMKVSKHLGSTKFLLLSIKLYFQISRCWTCFAKTKNEISSTFLIIRCLIRGQIKNKACENSFCRIWKLWKC